ncbi:MAG TPA: histidine--tRNA ligase [Blastocatellia bacterium]|nr:histidine--tRNA ligase [Blastocatellia bacterium]
MSDAKSVSRPVPRLPKGFRDTFARDVLARRRTIDTIRKVYELYGFAPLETSAIEYVEALGKFLPESSQPAGGIFAFQDEDNAWLALRYDLTAPLSRIFSEYRSDIPIPFRRYQVGVVWRNEKPGPGRFREFYQFDIDTVGTASMAADAEVCCVLADALEALGISRGDYVIRVNNRKALNGVIEAAGIASNEETMLTVLRAIDKLDRIGIEGVKELLGKGRVEGAAPGFRVAEHVFELFGAEGFSDAAIEKLQALKDQDFATDKELLAAVGEIAGRESLEKIRGDLLNFARIGDFTRGANLSDGQIQRIVALLSVTASRRTEVCEQFAALVGDSQVGQEGVAELRGIDRFLTAVGYDEARVVFDPTVVRGLAYYTGPVFEAALTFETTDETGQKRQFGSVAGGGRYDYLVERFIGEKVPATGASIGVDRLLAALSYLGKLVGVEASAPVIVTVMDQELILEYEKMTFELRRAGITAEMYLGSGGFRKQMKYADEREAIVAVIAGSREFESGTVSLKDLRLGAELSKSIGDRQTWLKEQAAQVTVPVTDLVAEVRKILARYGLGQPEL